MEGFVNEFAANPQVFPALITFLVLGNAIFGYLYNMWMDHLATHYEHMSLYVAGGVGVVLLFGALISWQAFVMYLVLFIIAGAFMIAGEYRRTDQRRKEAHTKSVRRKRLPYAANARIEDAYDSIKEAQRLIGLAFRNNGSEPKSAVPMAEASHQLSTALTKLMEVKAIQQVDE